MHGAARPTCDVAAAEQPLLRGKVEEGVCRRRDEHLELLRARHSTRQATARHRRKKQNWEHNRCCARRQVAASPRRAGACSPPRRQVPGAEQLLHGFKRIVYYPRTKDVSEEGGQRRPG